MPTSCLELDEIQKKPEPVYTHSPESRRTEVMKKLYQRVVTVMADDGENKFSPFGFFLYLLSLGYGAIITCWDFFYKKGIFKIKELPCYVISVGNITMGGTGKTPTIIYLARMIKRQGYQVVVLSRGYKALAKDPISIVSDGQRLLMDADSAGDEPCLMATQLDDIPVIIGKNRFQSGLLACDKFKPHVILLDDAFQHRKLARDINLILLDYKEPLGNGHLLPRGTLREGPGSLFRGDGIIFTRSDMETPYCLKGIKEFIRNKPIFKSVHQPYISKIIKKAAKRDCEGNETNDLRHFREKSVYAFSGIGNNAGFRSMLIENHIRVIGFSSFPDHHDYTIQDIDAILKSAQDANAVFLFTTEKDFIKVSRHTIWPMDLIVVGVEIVFEDNYFELFIQKALESQGFPLDCV